MTDVGVQEPSTIASPREAPAPPEAVVCSCGATFRPVLTDGRCPRCRRVCVAGAGEAGPLERLWSRLIARPEGVIAVLVVMAIIQLVLFVIVVKS